MRTILIILAAVFGLAASGATNEPTIQMLATTNGVVKLPTNITSVRIGGTVFTNLLGFGLAVSNNQLSVDTTQLPAGGGGGGSGTVTSVGASTTVSGLGFSGSPVTESGTLSLTGTVAVASGGTGATDASGARTALSLVPGADVQAYDVDLAAIAALANSGIIVRTGSGTVAARTITGDTEAVVNNGDGVSGNPTLSIGAAIARDAEVAAAYQPLDADLTAMAAGTAVATAQTNAVSMGAPVLYAGSTNVPAAIALKAPLASPAFTTSATIGGTNVLDYAASHQTEAEASALYQRTNTTVRLDGTTPLTGAWNTGSSAISANTLSVTDDAYDATGWNGSTNVPTKNAVRDKIESISAGSGLTDGGTLGSATITNLTTKVIIQSGITSSNIFAPNRKRVVLVDKDWMAGTAANAGLPELANAAISSGTVSIVPSETNHIGVIRLTSSSSANSGYSFLTVTSQGFTHELLTWESITRAMATNAGARVSLGFSDSTSLSAPTDAIRTYRSNNFVIPQIYNNSALTEGFAYPIQSNQWIYTKIQVDNLSQSVSFYVADSDAGTEILSTNIATSLPLGQSRVFAVGALAGHTNTTAVSVEDLDWTTAYIDQGVAR